MKVMILAPYIYDEHLPEFTRNKTGFGIMVRNIAAAIGERADVVLATRVLTKGRQVHADAYRILPHTPGMIFADAKMRDYVSACVNFFKRSAGLKNRIRQAFYALDSGYIRKQLKRERPDIVHIHGIGSVTEGYIRVCEELGVKYCVTLHGLIGLDASVSAADYEKELERDFLIRSDRMHVPVSVISSGMKYRIEKNYLQGESTNLTVILNGTDIKKEICHIDSAGHKTDTGYMEDYKRMLSEACRYPALEDTYSFLKKSKDAGKKILYFVGNITPNKNQMQAVGVMEKSGQLKNAVLVLWGREVDGGAVRKKITSCQLAEQVILGGFNDRMEEFWKLCDMNLFLSKNDGFGLPIIEGYMHGVPCITFEDLDATEDLYFPEAMIKVRERSTDALEKMLVDGLKKQWDHLAIQKDGQKFSVQMMAKSYEKWYRGIIA